MANFFEIKLAHIVLISDKGEGNAIERRTTNKPPNESNGKTRKMLRSTTTIATL